MFSTYPTMFRVYLKAIDAIATGKVCSCKKILTNQGHSLGKKNNKNQQDR